MAGQKKKKTSQARNPETRENYLINLAMNAAEEKLLNGTATSQIIVTLLKLGTIKAQLEIEKIRSDLKVADAKVQQMRDQETSGALYEAALKAFKYYKGEEEDEFDDEEEL